MRTCAMRPPTIATAVLSTLLVVGYAVLSGRWVASSDVWYRSLSRPPWQPPSVVIGLIWPYNFAVLIAAGLAVAFRGTTVDRVIWLAALLLSIIAALSWARLFYVGHALWPAATALILAAALNLPAVIAAWRTRTWAGAVLVPYAVWLILAASLAIGYARRN